MKGIFLLVLLCSTAFKPIDTGHTWVYQNPEVVTNIASYDTALAAADLDRFRYIDQRSTITFDNGLKVELLSANEVTAMGLPVKMNHVRTHEPSAYKQSTFKLLDNGLLVELPPMQKVK